MFNFLSGYSAHEVVKLDVFDTICVEMYEFLHSKGMSDEKRQPKQSPVRITTVIDYDVNENGELDDDDDDRSNVTPIVQVRAGGCFAAPEQPTSPNRQATSLNRIAIEIKVSQKSGSSGGVIEVNPGRANAEFLTGSGEMLTKSDFMHMIQEGVRIGVSNTANSNRMKTLKKVHAGEASPVPVSASSSNQQVLQKKTMKYILNQYKPKNFQNIRKLSGISTEEFIQSICDSELIGGFTESSGKSGSLFWYSSDKKYIMKSISVEESALLNRICSSYLRYVGTHPHSLLCKFFGMFKIVTTVAAPSYIRGNKRPSRIRSGQVQTTRFVIMNNVFYSADDGGDRVEKFDLKGTTEDRFVKQVSGNEVMKDINFQNRWVSIPENLADCLTRVVQEDCEFLARHGIMDYSLIIGVKRSNKQATFEHLSEPYSGTVETDTGIRKSTLQEKLKKAAHSVQKLLSPSTSSLWMISSSASRAEHHTSRLPSIHENNREDFSGPAEPTSGNSPSVGYNEAGQSREGQNPPSVFCRFNNGVAGLDETKENCLLYFFGIIDILQQYTIRKKLAHLMKKFTIGCCHEIDTVAPAYYRSRFERYAIGKIHALEEDEIDACIDKLNVE